MLLLRIDCGKAVMKAGQQESVIADGGFADVEVLCAAIATEPALSFLGRR